MTTGASLVADRASAAMPAHRPQSDPPTLDIREPHPLLEATACLAPLLDALGWRGTPRQLAEALPHLSERLDLDDLLSVLANLRYTCRPVDTRMGDIDERLLPCLFVANDGSMRVLLENRADGLRAFDGGSGQLTVVDDTERRGTGYFFAPSSAPAAPAQPPEEAGAWLASMAGRFRGLAWQVFGIAFLNSVLALAAPLFILAIYDWVIPSGSTGTLAYLGAGIVFVIGADFALRLLRGRYLAYVGGRIDTIFGTVALERLVYLPIGMITRSPLGAQLARLKQFEAVRDFFTGPLAAVFLDLPFVPLFLAVMAWIAGPVALIPAVLVAVFAVCVKVVNPRLKAAVAAAGQARAARQSFLIEMLTYLRSIKGFNGEDTWRQRHRELSATAAMASYRAARVSAFAQTTAQVLMQTAAVATLTYGAHRVLAGDMSVGALVASMALAWRILGPLQSGFTSMLTYEQVRLGAQQLDRLMRLKPEREPGLTVCSHRTINGSVTFDRVSLRYTPQGAPALLGVDFKAAPGEIIAITGPSGAGKSTALKLLAGLYQPQAGAVLIDGIDIRQLDCGELRHAIAYVPQHCHLFHGTVAQNLRLANPAASDQTLLVAAEEAAVLNDILALPDGFDTRLTDRVQRRLPKGFNQRLMLARAYVKDAPICLFDEPGKLLDGVADRALMTKIQSLRSRSTVIFITHRPSHMRLADRVLYIDGGRVVLDGPPADVLKRLNIG